MPNSPNKPDELLTILARDARATVEHLSKLTGRKPEEIKKQIEQWEKTGVIKRYKTIVDWEKTGVETVVAFIDVKVMPGRDVGYDAIARRIYRFPEVKSVWLVSGDRDLRIVVEGPNIRKLGEFVAEKLATIDGVTETNTHFLLKRYKEDDDVFVDSEEDSRLVVTP
jgi:DNA-binding Lrp family transcriptional regulator